MLELERVLHIEDDLSIQEVARVALEIVGGFRVVSCSSGKEGLEQVEKFAPHVILLDVMMPGMDGPETLVHLQQMPSLSQVPVIFMTAKVQGSELDEYHQLGAAGVISKPFDPMTLADQIRTLWSQFHADKQ